MRKTLYWALFFFILALLFALLGFSQYPVRETTRNLAQVAFVVCTSIYSVLIGLCIQDRSRGEVDRHYLQPPRKNQGTENE